MKKTLMVNEVRPAYTHYLNVRKIKRLAKNNKVSKDSLVKEIKAMIAPAASTYAKNGITLKTKKTKFIAVISSARMTKEDIVKYCINSVNKANQTEALQNTRSDLAQ